jgi:putative DNA primase/helicase
MEQHYIDFNISKEEKSTLEQQDTIEIDEGNDKSHQFAISKFNHERDSLPKAVNLSWDTFCVAFKTHKPMSTKAGNSAWSPATYKNGEARSNKNVINITMAVIDVDNGTAVEAIQKKLEGYVYLIHSSYSHTADKPKYRAILPLHKPVSANEWPDYWQRINEWLGGINDPATKDASRLYYMPACPLGSTSSFVLENKGKLLNLNELPELSVDLVEYDAQKIGVSTYHHIEGIEPIPPDALGSVEQLNEMQAKCSFIQWAIAPANQPSVSEPLWGAMISNQCRFEGGNEAIHEGSSDHPGYDENATDSKIERCFSGSAPITCKRIHNLGFKDCPSGGCKLPSGVVTRAPAGLGVWANKKMAAAAVSSDAVVSTEFSVPKDLQKYINSYHGAGLVFVGGSFFGYKKGYWPRLDEQADMRRSIAYHLSSDATPNKVAKLLTLAKDFYAAKAQEVSPNSNLICLANGTLNVENGELLEFNPDHHLATKNDIHWSTDAKCDRWLRFLDEIFVNDADKAEKIAFLKMWFGYCLIPDSSQHKFVWMVGAGGNGKSVLLTILTKLVGESNVSHAHIERLDDKNVRAELQAKLVNISSEMSAGATLADGYIKAIVAGDMVEAERKYQPSFSFKPYVKLIAATNNLPRLFDLTDGFFRRAIILSFNRQFTGKDIDVSLEAKLTAELAGILAWSVAGLKELRENGAFNIPSSSSELLAAYRTESDPVKLFADECLESTSEGGRMKPIDIYTGYRQWCAKNGMSPLNSINFGKGLGRLGFTKRRSGGKEYWRVTPKADNAYLWDVAANEVIVALEKANAVEVASKKYKL